MVHGVPPERNCSDPLINKKLPPSKGPQKLTICDTACYDECAPKRGQKEALFHRRRLATSLRREVRLDGKLSWEVFCMLGLCGLHTLHKSVLTAWWPPNGQHKNSSSDGLTAVTAPFLFPLYHPAPVCQENRPELYRTWNEGA